MPRAFRIIRVLAACILMMSAHRHDRWFWFRALISSALFIGLYAILPMDIWGENALIHDICWLVSLGIDVLIIHYCIDCSWGQAVNCMSYAIAIQFVFGNIKSIHMVVAGGNYLMFDIPMMIIVYAFLFWIYGKKLMGGELSPFKYTDLIAAACLILFNVTFGRSAPRGSLYESIGFHLLYMIFALSMIHIQALDIDRWRVQNERDHLEDLFTKQKNQYEIIQSTIDIINHKCHDLKHQIHHMQNIAKNEGIDEYIREVSNAISIYNTDVHTGNKALDTVLMEKGLICNEKQIFWSCMADGTRIHFIRDCDIYSLFGNLLDNAIEAAAEQQQPERRIVNLTVTVASECILIIVENIYSGNLIRNDDLFATTKGNPYEHGYGLLGVSQLIDKYDGVLTITTDDNIFCVQAMIPIPNTHLSDGI